MGLNDISDFINVSGYFIFYDWSCQRRHLSIRTLTSLSLPCCILTVLGAFKALVLWLSPDTRSEWLFLQLFLRCVSIFEDASCKRTPHCFTLHLKGLRYVSVCDGHVVCPFTGSCTVKISWFLTFVLTILTAEVNCRLCLMKYIIIISLLLSLRLKSKLKKETR